MLTGVIDADALAAGLDADVDAPLGLSCQVTVAAGDVVGFNATAPPVAMVGDVLDVLERFETLDNPRMFPLPEDLVQQAWNWIQPWFLRRPLQLLLRQPKRPFPKLLLVGRP